ncbi:MAG: prepilin-type N-terminal cleavage/methylation domain-containing protein [Gemmatimonadales bacterium]
MLNRRGITLVELLISMVVLAIIGVTITKVMSVMLNTSTAQITLANSMGEARNGTLSLPQELREVGYDTNVTTLSASTDLIAIAAHRISFKAMRGMAITCGTPTLTEFKIRKPITGQRLPRGSDEFLLFVENDPNASFDDQWLPMAVSVIDSNSTCGTDPAMTLTLSATPLVKSTTPTVAMAISQHRVGGPVRWYERVEYGPFIDGTSGQAFIGVRSISLGEAAMSPVIGPLPDTTHFTLTYYNAAGTVLNPAAVNPLLVRSIGVAITTVTDRANNLAGNSASRATTQYPMYTRVALRNALRP